MVLRRQLWQVALAATLVAVAAHSHRGSAAPGAGPQTDDDQLLKTGKVGTDGPSLIAYFRNRTVTPADRQRIDLLIRSLGDPAYAVRERASADLVVVGMSAIGPLRDAATNADVEITRRAERCLEQIERVPSAALSAAAARAIARRKPAGAVEVLLAYLPVADDEAVADEVREALAAVAITDGKADPTIATALDDPTPLKRGAAAEALARTAVPGAVELSRKALADSNSDVRLRTALALVTRAKDKTAIPTMIGLLGELPQGAGWRIEDVLIRLAGDAAPKVTLGDDAAAREKCRDAWKEWWDKNGPATDLAKLDGAAPMLGNTLLVLRDRAGGGRVLELNNEKKELWKIEGLQLPADAVVVGPDRVLIAETGAANQVSERDFSGKVIWAKPVEQPTGVRRLPNGNTFVVSRSRLIEFDARRREVFSYPRPQYDICAAQKLRGGDVIFVTFAGQCIRLDSKGKEGKPFAVGQAQSGIGFDFDVLHNNHVLVTQQGGVAEYDGTGGPPVLLNFSRPTSVQRLSNGNTLVATSLSANPTVAELDRTGQVVWEYKPEAGLVPYRARRR